MIRYTAELKGSTLKAPLLTGGSINLEEGQVPELVEMLHGMEAFNLRIEDEQGNLLHRDEPPKR